MVGVMDTTLQHRVEWDHHGTNNRRRRSKLWRCVDAAGDSDTDGEMRPYGDIGDEDSIPPFIANTVNDNEAAEIPNTSIQKNHSTSSKKK